METILLLIALFLLISALIAYLFFRIKRIRREILNQKIVRREFSNTNRHIIKRITSNNSKFKILIVEDDPVNRKILKSQLTSAKYTIETAEDGAGALETLNRDSNIDLVILDIMLPDFSGFTVCKAIRKKYTMFEKPVIMVTAKNKIEDLLDGFEAGANDFILKPYNIYELIARINSSLSLMSVVEHNTSLTKINKLKSDIIDMAAHDLKSPLTIISGYARRIIKKSNSKDEELVAGKILDSSNKMLDIVTKLLEDSKEDDFNLTFSEIDVVKLIKNSIDLYLDTAKSKKQIINFYKNTDEVSLNIDKESFSTIIDNLLSNAIKYSPFGSIIDLTLTDENDKCIISIADEGNGFTKDELDNLFSKYFPISNKPTNGESSTGLGLSIVNNMVKRNKGYINVESEKTKGSEFILTFSKS